MPLSLPTQPSLTHLRHQAKALVKAHRQGLAEGLPVLRQLRKFARATDREILAAPLALHEVQYALAMQHGFGSWDQLRRYVQSVEAQTTANAASLLDPESLGATVDHLNQAFFEGRKLSLSVKEKTAEWIASRQSASRGYGGLFAPTELDFRQGIRFFTGEGVRTGAGTAHILGEEAGRALILLDVKDKPVREALERATAAFTAAARLRERKEGTFCCGKCSVAMWRHLAVGGLCDQRRLLSLGLKVLKDRRDGKGKWRTFPFYYTLLALTEIDMPPARVELRYAAPVCERLLKRPKRQDDYDLRRRAVLERALARA